MSPTSYQTAPPRDAKYILAADGRVFNLLVSGCNAFERAHSEVSTRSSTLHRKSVLNRTAFDGKHFRLLSEVNGYFAVSAVCAKVI
jgi:hypothetical protein